MKKKVYSLLLLGIPFLATVILPIISVVCLGNIVLNNYNERIIQEKQNDMKIAFEHFQQKIDMIENVGYMIAISDEIVEYTYSSEREEHTIVECMEVQEFLKTYMIIDDIKDIFLFDVHDNRVITPNVVLSEAAMYFTYIYQQEGYTPEESIERLQAFPWGVEYTPAMKAKYQSMDTEIIEYRFSLRLSSAKNIQGYLVMLIDTQKLFEELERVMGDGGEFYVYDGKDNLLYRNGNKLENLMDINDISAIKAFDTDLGKIYGQVYHSEDDTWKIKAYMPDILENIKGIIPVYMWVLIVLPVIVSVSLCIYFTYKKHREILELLYLFKQDNKPSMEDNIVPEFKVLREYVANILNDNHRFQERINDFEDSRKKVFLNGLIRNVYADREEMLAALKEVNLNIKEGNCIVLCIRYEGSSYRTEIAEGITLKDFVNSFITNLLERQFEIFDTSARESICVFSVNEGEDADILMHDIISNLNVQVVYHFDIEMKLSAGNVVDSLYRVSESYIQAKKVLDYNETSGKKLYLCSELEGLENIYYYPREYDEKIYNYIMVGNVEEARNIIRKIYVANFENNSVMLSGEAIENVKNRIRDCIVSLVDKYDMSFDEVTKQLDEESNIHSYFETFSQVVERICEVISDKKQRVQDQSASKIMKYIRENYQDSTLSLKQISLVFDFSEAYISRLFKTVYGENVSAVIEQHRIEKACDLIRNTNMKVGDIAEQIGYTSDASFRRAFKRITGISPSEYKVIE